MGEEIAQQEVKKQWTLESFNILIISSVERRK